MIDPGRTLILFGLVLIAVGIVVSFAGRLPGDLVLRGERWTFSFPLVTSIVVSIVLTLVLNLWLAAKGPPPPPADPPQQR